MRRVPEHMITKARALRNGQTEAERLIWRRLSSFRPRFTRQLVVGPFIVDLACRSARLAIEFDGSQHLEAEAYDGHRSDYLVREGWTVLRFWNGAVLENPDGVAEAISGKAAECLGGTRPRPIPSRERRKKGEPLPGRQGRRLATFDKMGRVYAQLLCHPQTPHPAISEIAVEVEQCGSALRCRYIITGDVSALVWEAATPGRADDLWRHTCCELFLKGADESYLEFNFAPSGQWAAYRFDRYREGVHDAEGCVPELAAELSDNRLVLVAEVDLSATAMISLGLSAVIETREGAKSYWAIAHPPGKPDFHHPDCFAIQFPAPKQP